MRFTYSPIYHLVLTALASYSTCTLANENAPDNNDIEMLDTIEVVAEVHSHNNKPQQLSEAEIKRTPKGNSTINSLLRKNGAIHYSNNSNNSVKGGEIEPELVSFHGEPYYNNLFLIDGLSNNDIINPGYSNGGYNSVENSFEVGANLYLAPGSPESFQIDSALLRKISIYDSNVPAKYTNFTGGVVDAELKDADPQKASGRISYRTTRDRWTYFHFNPQESEQIAYNDALNNIQPEFRKHIYNLTANQPLSDKTALLFSYNRTQSFIPENHWLLGQRVEEKRLAETYMLKATHWASDSHKINASFIYSPHKNVYYADNIKNGRYSTSGGGYRAALSSELFIDHFGQVKTSLDYSYQRNRVKYDTNAPRYIWIGNMPNTSLDWCSSVLRKNGMPYCAFSREGGLGELNTETKTWTLKQDYEMLPIETQWGTHQLDFGWSVSLARATSARPHDARFYYNTDPRAGISRSDWESGKIVVPSDCTDCLPNEQFQTMLIRYPQYYGKALVNNYSLYFDDEWTFGGWELHPAMNVTYDSFLKNLNIAPRFMFNWDIIGEKKFTLSGGLNRYYSGNILANALRSTIPPDELHYRKAGNTEYELLNYNRWIRYNNIRHLKTPYSDEANFGFSMQFWDQLFSAKYVYRHGQRQFMSYTDQNALITLPKGKTVKATVMSNDGENHSNSLTFVLRNMQPLRWGALELSYQLGFNLQKIKSNSLTGYLNSSNSEETSISDDSQTRGDYYIYNNQSYDDFNAMRGVLPALNFDARWNAFLEINTDLPQYNFKWTHYLNYRPGYTSHGFKRGICGETVFSNGCRADGDKVSVYRTVQHKKAFVVDWSFLYEIPLPKATKLELSIDVLNVFNSRVATANTNSKLLSSRSDADSISYQLGRQYWFGVAYNW